MGEGCCFCSCRGTWGSILGRGLPVMPACACCACCAACGGIWFCCAACDIIMLGCEAIDCW